MGRVDLPVGGLDSSSPASPQISIGCHNWKSIGDRGANQDTNSEHRIFQMQWIWGNGSQGPEFIRGEDREADQIAVKMAE